MGIAALSAVVVLLSGAAHGAGFGRPLGGGKTGGAAAACAPRPNEGPCDPRDYEEAFVIPSEIWGDAIESSGCPQDSKAALTARLESAAAWFNAGVLTTRKGFGDQTAAQEGAACARAASDETRYVGKQRLTFYSRWQDEVAAWLARCPPSPREAPKAKRRAARRAPACRFAQYDDGASGGCESAPFLPRTRETSVAGMIHASVQSCPERTRTSTGVIAGARRANFRMAEEFNRWAANYFLTAQGGVRCDDVAAAYRDYTETASGTFHAAWLEKTAATGAACGGGN